MRQAIVTKYHGPTNKRGARISATAAAGRIYLPYNDALSLENNHTRAAHSFAARLEWYGPLHGGCLPDGRYAFVFKD